LAGGFPANRRRFAPLRLCPEPYLAASVACFRERLLRSVLRPRSTQSLGPPRHPFRPRETGDGVTHRDYCGVL